MTGKIVAAVLLFVLSSLCAACGGSHWKGREFTGEGTINGVKPARKTVENFRLETRATGKNKRKFITMDAANAVLAGCGLEVWNRAGADEGKFELVYPDTRCETVADGKAIAVIVTLGEISVEQSNVKLTLFGIDRQTGRMYDIEISGKAKAMF